MRRPRIGQAFSRDIAMAPDVVGNRCTGGQPDTIAPDIKGDTRRLQWEQADLDRFGARAKPTPLIALTPAK
jgi:hypothetical protein